MAAFPVAGEPPLVNRGPWKPLPRTGPDGGRSVVSTGRSRSAREQLAYVATSVASDACSLMAAVVVTARLWSRDAALDAPAVVLAVTVWLTVLWGFGVYRLRPGSQVGWGRLLAAVACWLSIAYVAVPSSSFPVLRHPGYLAVCAFAFASASRASLHSAVRRGQREGRFRRRALIVGTDDTAVRLAEQLPATGITPVGFVLTSDARTARDLPFPIAGHIGDLGNVIRGHDASCVVAAPTVHEVEVFEMVRAARRHGAEARIASEKVITSPTGPAVDPVGLDLALALRSCGSGAFQMRLKRSFDVVAASAALLLMAPTLAAVGLAVLVSSGRPVFFRQKRITQGGRPFTVYKFRTMVVGADRRAATPDSNPDVLFYKSSDRSLLTPVGDFLRRFSIDELPQLWNVVRGDMSLVGPRPLPTGQVEAHSELLARRHDLPTGLTGWWQINGRSDVDADHALDMDLFYVENWSFAFDLYILLKTARAVVSRTGAY